MGIAAPLLHPILKIATTHHQPIAPIQSSNSSSADYSMSQQDYHETIFSFSNGFERSSQEHHHQQQQQHQHQHHLARQIRRDKLRVQASYEPPPPPLVGIEEEVSGGLPVYEAAGMLSEMFNFPPGGVPATATELLDQQLQSNYRRQQQQEATNDWYVNNRQNMVGGLGPLGDSKNHDNRESSLAHHHHHQISGINEDSAAAMQLFLMNPQPRSPSPTPSHPHPPSTSSTLHVLLPNPSTSLPEFSVSGPGGGFGASTVISPPLLTWVPDSSHQTGNTSVHHVNNPSEIGSVVEGQGLSLSLSSSLQHLDVAKAEELRMGDGGLLYYNQGAGSSSSGASHYYKNFGGQVQHQSLHLQGPQNHQVHIGFGSSLGVVNVLRNSKYVKTAQELLEEFCSVGRGQFKKNKLGRHNSNPSSNNPVGGGSGGSGGGSCSSTKDVPPLSAADRIEHQRRKVKLLTMLDEVDRRYNHYCEQMQMVVNSFDLVMGYGAAVPYTALAQKAMSRHFRCLKDAIAAQLKHSCELLGEKDGTGTSGITKGETPRLRLLEQSLRQQRAFHQIGMMEQEAWRPQRGLPERSVNILRAWLFEHFLHPYPSDADKHLLARQTGLSRNQVSNWFINARVRLWKPMVEDMYQQENKEEDSEGTGGDGEKKQNHYNNNSGLAQAPMPTTSPTNTTTTTTSTAPPVATTAATTTAPTLSTTILTSPAGKRSEINAIDSDPSLLTINRQCFSENQARPSTSSTTTTTDMAPPPPLGQTFHDLADETCRRGSMAAAEHYGTTSANANVADIGSTLVRFGTTGDVSLTLGLRHAGGNIPVPEKTSSFSFREFGGC
ncbi:hypothetical protein K2173_021273 [Erythroxylum novogranatense]|uniref:Homeobox domain-containing protein n=1 Tax=Erythroxylum novogranatense TaxID=1862640 RepID=A0AAV8TVV6_9ROSI|nr:hypothetical protein K2173_021273 [Erythroxylum novogranatense]